MTLDRKVTQMLWAPLKLLNTIKPSQFGLTDDDGDTHYLQHHSYNGTNMRKLIDATPQIRCLIVAHLNDSRHD